MPRRPTRSHLAASLLALPFAACATLPDEISGQLLTPPPAWHAEPADFGLDAEGFEVVIHSDATLTGWWLPHDDGERRTVVLLHDGDTNASAVHPWYRFLHDAGFQVLVVDPRGYGRSKGTPTLRAWLQDLPELFEWLRARPDVDPARIAVYGTGLGSVAAMWAARTQGCQALVVEHLPSVLDMVRESQGGGDGAGAALRLGFSEYALPDEIEPDDNAPRTKVPALFVATDGELARDRKALVRTYGNYAGAKQLWVLERTGRAPHGMLTYGNEYPQRVAAFLRGALAGAPPVCRTTARKVDVARDGDTWWQIDVELPAGTPREPAPAIEACAVLADGSTHFARGFAGQGRLRVKLSAPPVATSAVVVPDAVRDERSVFRREPTPAARAAAALDAAWDRIQALRSDALPPIEQPALADELAAAEQQAPFPPELEAELADVFARLGQHLRGSSDAAQQARGEQLLRRAAAAVPPRPELHVWLGPHPTFGYPQQEAVDAARRLVATPPK